MRFACPGLTPSGRTLVPHHETVPTKPIGPYAKDPSRALGNRQFNSTQFNCATFGVRPKFDLFANRYNRQLNQFYSMRPDPKALGVNALVQKWDTPTVLYANPMWSLIPDFLRKVDASRATVLAVLPVW